MRKTTKDLQAKDAAELQKSIQLLVEEIAKLKIDAKVNAPKDTNTVFKKRKELARLKTAYAAQINK